MNTGEWTKSSFSNGSGGNNCVEIWRSELDSIAVRNSRFPSDIIGFTPDEWRAFIAGVKAGEFDLPAE